MSTESTAEQLRRRREAAGRLEPLDCGHRDPLDCQAGCPAPPEEPTEDDFADQIDPGDIAKLWADAKSLYFAEDFPPYASPAWRALHPDDPKRLASALHAAECWRLYGDDVTQWLDDALAPRPPISSGRSLAERDRAAAPRAAHVLHATPGWPPIAIPGQPGSHLTYRQELAA